MTPDRQVDPRTLPLYLCTRKGKRFILIKQQLDAEHMGLLKQGMYSLYVEHVLTPEDWAQIRRAEAAAAAGDRKAGTR